MTGSQAPIIPILFRIAGPVSEAMKTPIRFNPRRTSYELERFRSPCCLEMSLARDVSTRLGVELAVVLVGRASGRLTVEEEERTSMHRRHRWRKDGK